MRFHEGLFYELLKAPREIFFIVLSCSLILTGLASIGFICFAYVRLALLLLSACGF